MIENLNFSEVENIRISCITGYKIKVNDNGNKYVQTLGFKVDINQLYNPKTFLMHFLCKDWDSNAYTITTC